ncbi:MAG: OmpA family protein, partial [Elusimicrobiota bacterium]|nr:OmpA family protein [Elusimicrobiota bacterium]
NASKKAGRKSKDGVEIPDLFFDEDSIEISPENEKELIEFASKLTKVSPNFKRIVIFVRVSSSEDELSVKANQLTLQKAKRVRKVLKENKISSRKIQVQRRKTVVRNNRIAVRMEV